MTQDQLTTLRCPDHTPRSHQKAGSGLPLLPSDNTRSQQKILNTFNQPVSVYLFRCRVYDVRSDQKVNTSLILQQNTQLNKHPAWVSTQHYESSYLVTQQNFCHVALPMKSLVQDVFIHSIGLCCDLSQGRPGQRRNYLHFLLFSLLDYFNLIVLCIVTIKGIHSLHF